MIDWISVDERLPEVPTGYVCGELVLIYTDKEDIRTGVYYQDGWSYDFDRDGTITHWAEINPPEKQ